jgi:putative addiction module component (TIGR02574 family)
MNHPVQLPPPAFDDLSVEEQIEYVQALWDRIAATEKQVPVPDWHPHILEERLAIDRTNPDSRRDWDDFETDSTARFRKPR